MFYSLREVSAREFNAHQISIVELGSRFISASIFARPRDPISTSSENSHPRSKATKQQTSRRKDMPFQILIARDSRRLNNNDARDATDRIRVSRYKREHQRVNPFNRLSGYIIGCESNGKCPAKEYFCYYFYAPPCRD